jgi:hypothetical protein
MSIFSYGYIGMDISEMMTSEVSEISEIRYIQISDMFILAMDILEMDISELTSSDVSEIHPISYIPPPLDPPSPNDGD